MSINKFLEGLTTNQLVAVGEAMELLMSCECGVDMANKVWVLNTRAQREAMSRLEKMAREV